MLVKNIINNTVSIQEKLKLSLFKPQGLRRLLELVPPNNFVLGVGYEEGDYQICISGRKKIDEKLNKAVVREMSEELALSTSKEYDYNFKHGKNYFYSFKLSDLDIVNTNFVKYNKSCDSRERVIACVHGSQIEIVNYLNEVRLKIDNGDSITHIWADKVSNLLSHVKM